VYKQNREMKSDK